MHYFLYPTKDTFITNDPEFVFKNAGLDEVLEVEKITKNVRTYSSGTSGSIYPQSEVSFGSIGTVLSRALLHFNLTQISKSIVDGGINNIPKFYLNLKTAEAKQIPTSYTLVAYPMAVSWSMGTGYKYDGSTVPNGATWKHSDGTNARWWVSQSLVDSSGGGIWYVSSSLLGSGSGYAQPPFVSPNPYDPFPDCSSPESPTVPITPISPVTGGFACSQSFDYQTSDVRMDVTTIVNAWLSQTIPNHGLIILHSGESDSIDYGKLRFFSKETNTIYSPYLDVAWDDSVFVTGSGAESYDPVTNSGSFEGINIHDAVVSSKNLSSEYKHGSIVRINVTARQRYPIKTFSNSLYYSQPTRIGGRFSDYLEPYYLPHNSYYSIKDAESEEVIIPHDSFTRLSFDYTGNYFTLDTTGLPQERYYKISIRSEMSGSIVTFDIPTPFKIVR